MRLQFQVETPFRPSLTHDLQLCLRQGVHEAVRSSKPTVVSFSVPAPTAEIVTLFDSGQLIAADRYLWAKPNDDFALVGLGHAWAIDVSETSRFRQAAKARQHLMSGAISEGQPGLPGVGPVLMAGFSFDAIRPVSRLWQNYPPGHLILPRLLFTRTHGETWLTYNCLVSAASDPELEAAGLASLSGQWVGSGVMSAPGSNDDLSAGNGRHAPVTEEELRPAAEWQADVANSISAIRRGELEKVVLARAVQLRSAHSFSARRALQHLASHYADCYLFAVARGARCFLGATPEQLVRLRDGEVKAMSLAGSIGRGQTAEEDERLARTLLNSAKDRREHAVVVSAMLEALGKVCSRLDVSPTPSLLKLDNIQHLYTPLTGRLADGHTLLNLVEQLHPTPAVGGRPRNAALRLIRETEKLDRGWYAGPVGWLDRQGEGEFSVAIRSALLHANEATLFAGCGIMADSDPEREYAESRLKLAPMLAALTGQ
jgi:isochorismate synthase